MELPEQKPGTDLTRPPDGTWQRTEWETIIAGATQRSLGKGLVALLPALFWNGIVGLFVLVVVGATCRYFGVELPHWYPAPMGNGKITGIGALVAVCLFLLPFIAIGLGLALLALTYFIGRVELRISRSQCEVIRAVGPLKRRRQFDLQQVTRVEVVVTRTRNRKSRRETVRHDIEVTFRVAKSLRFGSMLREDRRNYLAAVLEQARRTLVA